MHIFPNAPAFNNGNKVLCVYFWLQVTFFVTSISCDPKSPYDPQSLDWSGKGIKYNNSALWSWANAPALPWSWTWSTSPIWFTKLVFWETPEWTAPNRSLSFSSEWFAEKGKMEIYHFSHTPNYPFSFKNIFFVSAFLWTNATTYNKFERGVKPNCSKAKCSTWRMQSYILDILDGAPLHCMHPLFRANIPHLALPPTLLGCRYNWLKLNFKLKDLRVWIVLIFHDLSNMKDSAFTSLDLNVHLNIKTGDSLELVPK